MTVHYELNDENTEQVLLVETDELYEIKTHHGFVNQIVEEGSQSERIFFHGVFDLAQGKYVIDPADRTPIEVDGVLMPLDKNGAVTVRKAL
jgi:hypothetical protein